MTKEELRKSLDYVNEERERLQRELERKDNNWIELKEWLDKEKNKFIYSQINGNYFNMNYVIENYENVLDKIKELESK